MHREVDQVVAPLRHHVDAGLHTEILSLLPLDVVVVACGVGFTGEHLLPVLRVQLDRASSERNSLKVEMQTHFLLRV